GPPAARAPFTLTGDAWVAQEPGVSVVSARGRCALPAVCAALGAGAQLHAAPLEARGASLGVDPVTGLLCEPAPAAAVFAADHEDVCGVALWPSTDHTSQVDYRVRAAEVRNSRPFGPCVEALVSGGK